MKNIARRISVIVFLVALATQMIYAQQGIQVFLNDSLKITIDQSRGQLQWELSYDSIVWVPLAGQHSPTLEIAVDSMPVYFRLEITEGECDPWYSEVLEVTQATPFVCGDSISHGYLYAVTPDATPVFASRTYSTVQAAWTGTGGTKCWLKMNLGSTREANSATDTGLDAAGWFFQFNRSQGYVNDGLNRIPNTPWINPINETSDWVIGYDPCNKLLGGTWRIPTQTEWNAFLIAPIAQGGVASGYLSDAYASTLKLHAGGNLSGGDGSLQNVGTYAYLWSSGQNSSNTAGSFRFGTIGSFPVNATKNFAYTLRCIQD